METDRHTIQVRNAAAHSYQPAKYQLQQDDEDQEAEVPIVSDGEIPVGNYEPLPPHVQE